MWIEGRQGGGYLKLTLMKLWKMDAYLIKYPAGTGVKFHKDEVPNHKHYRLNIILKKPQGGGNFLMRGMPIFSCADRINVFRPDLNSHAVEVVTQGERLVLSIGIAI